MVTMGAPRASESSRSWCIWPLPLKGWKKLFLGLETANEED